MHKGIYKKFLEEADAEVTSITVDDLAARLNDSSLTLVDIRDIREVLRDGKIPNSQHAPRGMLEFWIDSESPYHKPIFAEDKTFVFYCAGGWRSLLAAQTAQRMGLKAMSLKGGFTAWKDNDHPVAISAKDL